MLVYQRVDGTKKLCPIHPETFGVLERSRKGTHRKSQSFTEIINVNRVKRVPPLLIVALKPPGRYVQYEEAIHRCLQDLWEMGIPGYPNSWMVHVKTHGKWIIHKQFIEINHPAIGLFS